MDQHQEVGPQFDGEHGCADRITPDVQGCGDVVNVTGSLIVNADDWGSDCNTTNRTLECVSRRVVSSVSGMVFMKDSERAAMLALERGIDVGLHLNFTTPFSALQCSSKLVEHQERCRRFLISHRFAPVVYHPGLKESFRYVAESQKDEFGRLYSCRPCRIDGHHHMHLCANVLLGDLLPPGIIVRRNFSFKRGERGPINRAYRILEDWWLARRYRITDFFFSLRPVIPDSRLESICSLSDRYSVEVETHPSNPEEFRFLLSEEWVRYAGTGKLARGYRIGLDACVYSSKGLL